MPVRFESCGAPRARIKVPSAAPASRVRGTAIAAVVALAATAGCSARDRIATSTAHAAAGNEVVCAHEAPAGSLVKRRVCRTRLEQQRARERSNAFVEDLRRRR